MALRESHLPLPPSSDFLNHLEDCVSATEECSRTLHAGLTRLEPGTRDLPRLSKLFTNKHHYLLLPYPLIQAHKSALSASLAPQIQQLITRAEQSIKDEAERVQRLEERVRILQSARLPVVEGASAFGVRAPRTFAGSELEGSECAGRGLSGGAAGVTDGQAQGVGLAEGGFLDRLEMKDLNITQRRKVVMLRGKRERLEKERAALVAAA